MPALWLLTEVDGHPALTPLVPRAATDADRAEAADPKLLGWLTKLGPAHRALLVEVIRRAPKHYLVATARWFAMFEHVLKSGNAVDAVTELARDAMRSPDEWLPETLR